VVENGVATRTTENPMRRASFRNGNYCHYALTLTGGAAEAIPQTADKPSDGRPGDGGKAALCAVIYKSAGEVLMATPREIDADQAVQDVLNAWGTLRTSRPEPQRLSTDFTALFAKMQAYRDAKNIADNSRARHKLTEQEAADERATKKVFLDAYRAFYEAR
jgi:hypothetical protein